MRAIILAAGKGTRLRPLTYETPKPLIIVNDKPLIERQIECLIDKGITDIIVVTGYLNHKFEYLKKKYNVKIIHNDKYDEYNNFYTMYLVKEYIADAYVIEGDIYMHHNIINPQIKQSSYFSPLKHDFSNEWMLKVDEKLNLVDIEVGSDPGNYIMCGVSYWSTKDGEFILNKLNEGIHDDFSQLFWDNIIKGNLCQLDIKVVKLKTEDLYEIDSLEDLKKIRQLLLK